MPPSPDPLPAGAPVRVLHTITRLIVGGAQENTLYTAARLPRERYQIEVLSGPQTGSEGSLIDEVRQNTPLIIDPHLLRQVSPLHDLRSLLSQYRLMRRNGYAIVHTHSSKAGILGRLAARLAGTPVVVHTVHGWSFHDYMSPAVRRAYILLERWMARSSDALVVVTERDIHKGLQAGIGQPAQYRLLRSGIPLDEFVPSAYDRQAERAALGVAPDEVVVGNVGRFSAQKNPLDWVKVAGIVARACPQARFVLVGDGPLHASVQAALQAEGIAGRTLLPGLRRDVARWLAVMDVFLLSSLWEGLPRVIPQAMAMGLPVVANHADGVVEAVQDGQTGFLCTPGDTPGMAGRVIELVNHPLLRQEMGARGRAAAAEFDLQTMLAGLDRLYQELLDAAGC
ncbi:MAG: glycosyltransferase family 4 protein [Chloroflexota bacterium]